MSDQTDDFDSPWKEVLEYYFREFAEFFFPQMAEDVDWDKGYDFLDKEFQQIVRESEHGRRFADKLARVWRKSGDEKWVLVHTEVQGQDERDFPKRMYVYNYRIFDKYDRPVASFAVLTDDRPGWRPDRYEYELWGCHAGIRFPVVKLTDYDWNFLEKSSNPFAVAHLKAQETRKFPEIRLRWKLNLIRMLYDRGYSRENILKLFRFIDWVMALPEELDRGFWQELSQYEKEKKMPYVTSVERIGIRQGIEKGIQQGIQQGIRQGIEKGIQQGIREGLTEGIELGLSLKFGDEGLKMMPAIRMIQDCERLRTIKNAIKTAKDISELKSVIGN